MLVPFSWLKEFVKININPQDLAEKLLLSGTKVEKLQKSGGDYIFDLEITTNRGDLFGILGVAREVSALLNADLNPSSTVSLVRPKEAKTKPINLIVSEKNLCPYFSLVVLDNLSLRETPNFIVERLEKSGMRGVGNIIVDLTNLVMIETAQPSHAFDYEKVLGRMLLRLSKKGEEIQTIDGQKRELPSGAIIIEDSEKIIDLAGLMGGKNSEVGQKTKTIILHVPIYNSSLIRKASLALNLRTQASSRFEKKLDPNGHIFAIKRLIKLFQEHCGANVATGIFSSKEIAAKEISFPLDAIEEILGIRIEENKVVDILSSLGFRIIPQPFEEKILKVKIPTWRNDVKEKEDICEEIGRIYGYGNFPLTLPKEEVPIYGGLFQDWEQKAKLILTSFGFHEIQGYTLTKEDSIKKINFSLNKTLRVINPLSSDFEVLRPTLLISLLTSLSLNLHNYVSEPLFELGRVFANEFKNQYLPYQPKRIAGILPENKFFEAKGICLKFLERLGISISETLEADHPFFETGEVAKIVKDKQTLGYFGNLNRGVAREFEVEEASFFELDFDLIENLAKVDKEIEPLPAFPQIIEDLSIIVEESKQVGKVLELIKKSASYLLKEVQVIDVYRGPQIGEGNKGVTIRLTFLSEKKTLTNSDIVPVRKLIIRNLEKNLVKIR